MPKNKPEEAIAYHMSGLPVLVVLTTASLAS